jgi:FtsP/CotA-like multicopper oxidase with cupredoxin domain
MTSNSSVTQPAKSNAAAPRDRSSKAKPRTFMLNPVAAAVMLAIAGSGATRFAHAGPGHVPTGTAGGYTKIDPNVVPNNGLGIWVPAAERPSYYANSPLGMRIDPVTGGAVDTGVPLRKFVDTLPGIGAAGANGLGQYLPVAVPDAASYPGSDYYEIGIVEYAEKVHSDLPKATTFRGYVQIDRAMTNATTTSASLLAAYQALVKGLPAAQSAYTAALAPSNTYAALVAGLAAQQAIYAPAFAAYSTKLAAYNLLGTNLAATQLAYNASYQTYITGMTAFNGNLAALATAQAAYTTAFAPLAAYRLLVANLTATQTSYNATYLTYVNSLATYNGYVANLATAQAAYTTAFAPLAAYRVLGTNLAATQTSYNASYQTYIASLATYTASTTGLAAAQAAYTTAFAPRAACNLLVTNLAATQTTFNAAYQTYVTSLAAYNGYVANLVTTQAAYTAAGNTYKTNLTAYNTLVAGMPAQQTAYTAALTTYNSQLTAYNALVAGLASAQTTYSAELAYYNSLCTAAPTLNCGKVGALITPPVVPAGYVDPGTGILAVAGAAPLKPAVPAGYADPGTGTLAVATAMPVAPAVPVGYVDLGGLSAGTLAVAGTAPTAPAVPAGYTGTGYTTTLVGTLAVTGPAPAAPAVPVGYVDLGGVNPNGTLAPAIAAPLAPAVPAGYTATGYTTTVAGTLSVTGPAPAAPAVPIGYVDAGGLVPNGTLAVNGAAPVAPAVPAGYTATGYTTTLVGTLAVTGPAPAAPAVPAGYVDVGGAIPSGTLAVAGAPVAPAVPAGYTATGYTTTVVGTLSVTGPAPAAPVVPTGYVDTGVGALNGILAVAGVAPGVPVVPAGYSASPTGVLSVTTPPPAGTAPASPGSKGIALWYPDGTPIMVYKEVGPNAAGVWDHSLVQPLTLVQAYAYDSPHYLGPVIVAQGQSSPTMAVPDNRPVRVKYDNLLPRGRATVTKDAAGNVTSVVRNGDLFLPFDTTLIGAGATPVAGELYMQNRAEVHLHGGITPWISDGTPHQWTVPVGETAASPSLMTGVSFQNVPDMPDPGQGAGTLYWTNAQSARLMFYHDHTVGQTRLNVYAGMAAGYVLTDAAEQGLMKTMGLDPVGIPLVIEDKSFVPKDINASVDSLLKAVPGQDAKWRTDAWGKPGDLWYPHVIEPNQDPNSVATQFTSPVGRWDYALWFWPVFPVTNSLPTGDYGNVTTTPEGLMDTPTVNGTAYPTLTVQPAPTRFRILNASNDRFQNLQLYVADSTQVSASGIANTEVKMVPAIVGVGAGALPDCAISADGYDQLILPLQPAINPATKLPFLQPPGAPATGPGSCWPVNWPTDGRVGGVPDPAAVGPTMWHIGSEGGLLPALASEPPVPTNYDYNRRSVTVLNVSQNNDPTQACSLANNGAGACHGLYLGPAERADVVVDFSAYAGKTLILYGDAPAPNPGYDPRIDYFTGDPDNTLNGGAPTTLAGYGPNTRTIMQIKVANTVPAHPTPASRDAYVAALDLALKAAYKASQDKPVVAQYAYDKALGTVATPAAGDQFARIFFGSTAQLQNTWTDGNGVAQTYCVPTVDSTVSPAVLNPLPANCNGGTILNKAIQELFDKYGRMNATLGTELPATAALTQTTLPFGYIDPATETLAAGETQIWKITHNGVDAHPVHFHLLNVQLINRVGWDGTLKAPEQGELGWKETIKMNPLEDVIVAVRSKIPPLPGFGLPKSVRPMDPSQSIGGTTDFMNLDPYTGAAPTTPTSNQMVDYDWEYVWHCHILGHEENDFMRPFVYTGLSVPPTSANQAAVAAASQGGAAAVGLLPLGTPGTPTLLVSGAGTAASPYAIKVSWTDNSSNEIGFRVERQVGANAFAPIGTVKSYTTTLSGYIPRVNALANATSMTDNSVTTPTPAGAATVATISALPATTAAAPASVSAAAFGAAGAPAYSVTLSWPIVANAGSYTVLRAPGLAATTGFAALPAAAGSVVVGATTATFTDASVLPNQSYTYQVQAVSANGTYTYRVYAVSATSDSDPATVTYSFNVANANSSNTPSAITAPLLVAVPDLAAQMIDASTINLSFTNLSYGETGYTLQYATSPGLAPTWTAVPATMLQTWSSATPAANGAASVTLSWPGGVPNNSTLRFSLAPTYTTATTTQTGPWSNTSNMIDLTVFPVMTGAPTVAPCNPAAAGCRSVAWPASASASSYSVQYSTAAGVWAAATMSVPVLSAGIYTATVTGLPVGAGQTYQMQIVGSNVNGSASGAASALQTAP